MKQKSVLEKALLEVESLEEAVKKNAKGILESTMKQELKNLLNEQNDDEEDVADASNDEDLPVDDTEDDVPVEDDKTGEDDETVDGEVPVSDEEVPSDDEINTEDTMDDDVLDMTDAPDEDVLKVFKAMKPEDGIIVKKDGNNLSVDIDGEEFMIKLDSENEPSLEPDMDNDESEPEMTDDESEPEMTDDESEPEMTDDELGSETGDEEEFNAGDESDTGDEDELTEQNENNDEAIYEIELDDEDDEENKPKEGEVEEAARTKSNPHGDKNGMNRAGIKSKKMFKAGSGAINEEVKKLKQQNKEYREALILFKDKLQEVAVFNSNLAYCTRLFTEHSTTKQEKLDILQRFDTVKTKNDSKNLFEQISKELVNKKPISEVVADKITSTPKRSSTEILSEQKTYENPQFKRMKELMFKIK